MLFRSGTVIFGSHMGTITVLVEVGIQRNTLISDDVKFCCKSVKVFFHLFEFVVNIAMLASEAVPSGLMVSMKFLDCLKLCFISGSQQDITPDRFLHVLVNRVLGHQRLYSSRHLRFVVSIRHAPRVWKQHVLFGRSAKRIP